LTLTNQPGALLVVLAALAAEFPTSRHRQNFAPRRLQTAEAGQASTFRSLAGRANSLVALKWLFGWRAEMDRAARAEVHVDSGDPAVAKEPAAIACRGLRQ
jgi:hypothetical protein